MQIDREILETDILIVGAGVAGLSTAYKIAKLVEEDGTVEMPETLIIDKGAFTGAHSLSGAVMDPKAIAELIPDFKDKGAPLEAEVSAESLHYLNKNGSTKFPFTPPSMNNHGNYVISLNKFTAWMGEQVENLGLDIFAGMAGFDLLIEDGKVSGVQTVDMGLNKEGEPKSNFEPGSIIKAKVIVLCEGVHGSLTKIALNKLPELTENALPQVYLTGVKEVWEVPENRIKAGQVIHTFGYPQENCEYGGGWVYGMSDTMASVGFAVGLNSPNPQNDPHLKFQLYKNHPLLKKILEGGSMLHYGAKTIPDNGYYSMPRLYHDNLLLCGDSAGFLNPAKLKGIHLAIKSGIMAAETIFDCIKKDDFSKESLSAYQDRFEKSWAKKELFKSRNFHAAFKKGLFSGLFHTGLQMITGGKGIFERRTNKPDHEYMLKIDQYQKKYGSTPSKPDIKFDNKYLFDKLTDVYKSGTNHEEEQPAHLVISDYDICNNRCTEEYGNPCVHFCPAHVYEMVEDDNDASKLRLMLTPSNCVHCKTCDIADPYQVINWVTPQGGEGPNYTNM